MKIMAETFFYFFLVLSWMTMASTQTCKTWVSIPPSNYNETFVEINSPQANIIRPLGFHTASLEFQKTPPCFIVSNTQGNGRHIEVKWELDLSGTLCVSDNEETNRRCSNGNNDQLCSVVPGGKSSVTYTFSCVGSNCESGEKNFWFRFVVEDPNDQGGFDENWCSSRDNRFPASLATLPSDNLPATISTTTTGGAKAFISDGKILSFFICLLIPFCDFLFF